MIKNLAVSMKNFDKWKFCEFFPHFPHIVIRGMFPCNGYVPLCPVYNKECDVYTGWQTNYNGDGAHFSHTKSMKKLLKTRKWALWDLLYFFVEAFSPIINIDWDIILQKFLVRYHRKFTPVFCMSLVKFCQQISTKNLVLGLKKKKKAHKHNK